MSIQSDCYQALHNASASDAKKMSVAKNYFEDILSGDIAIQQKCLDQLVEDINNKKERTIYNFLGDSGSEDFLWSLVTLLSSEDLRWNKRFVLLTISVKLTH